MAVKVSRKPAESDDITVAFDSGRVEVFSDIPSAAEFLGIDVDSLDIRFIPDIEEPGNEFFEYDLTSPPSAMGEEDLVITPLDDTEATAEMAAASNEAEPPQAA